MDAIQFCYWLRGFLELAEPSKITAKQIEEINNHLNLVLHKVTPTVNRSGDFPRVMRSPSWIPPSPNGPTVRYLGDSIDYPIPDIIPFNKEIQGSC